MPGHTEFPIALQKKKKKKVTNLVTQETQIYYIILLVSKAQILASLNLIQDVHRTDSF